MSVYRYVFTGVGVPGLEAAVGGGPVLGTFATAGKAYVDITSDAANKPDLDEYMSARGWDYLSTDPVITPEVQVAGNALLLANAIQLQGLDSGGTARDLIKISAGDRTILGNTTGPTEQAGGWIGKRVTTAGNYTLTQSDYYVGITNTAAVRTITLPDAPPAGTVYIIADETLSASNNPPIIDTTGAAKISGQNDMRLWDDGATLVVIGDGTDYHIIYFWPGKSAAGQVPVLTGGGQFRNAFVSTIGNTDGLSDYRGGANVQRRATAVSLTCDTASIYDYIVCVTSTAAPRTITLPAASAGRVIIVKDESGGAGVNAITVQPAAGTIDGAANYPINTNYGSKGFYSDGANWFTL